MKDIRVAISIKDPTETVYYAIEAEMTTEDHAINIQGKPYPQDLKFIAELMERVTQFRRHGNQNATTQRL